MPYINVKTNVSVIKEKEINIKSALGMAITAIPGKSEDQTQEQKALGHGDREGHAEVHGEDAATGLAMLLGRHGISSFQTDWKEGRSPVKDCKSHDIDHQADRCYSPDDGVLEYHLLYKSPEGFRAVIVVDLCLCTFQLR